MQKKIRQILAVLIGMLVASYAQGQGKIEVTVAGVSSGKGHVILMLYHKAEGFPSEPSKAYKRTSIPAKKGDMDFVFANLPANTYALLVVHDENSNGEMDKNFIGMPKERVGASNQSRLGRPSFERSKFALKKGEAKAIKLGFIN